jgi:hypothetical protein
MNERIRQLAEQAYDELVEETGNIVVFDEDFQQRFAQLIVQECCQFENSYGGDAGLVARSFSRKIKQHFGVEE